MNLHSACRVQDPHPETDGNTVIHMMIRKIKETCHTISYAQNVQVLYYLSDISSGTTICLIGVSSLQSMAPAPSDQTQSFVSLVWAVFTTEPKHHVLSQNVVSDWRGPHARIPNPKSYCRRSHDAPLRPAGPVQGPHRNMGMCTLTGL